MGTRCSRSLLSSMVGLLAELCLDSMHESGFAANIAATATAMQVATIQH